MLSRKSLLATAASVAVIAAAVPAASAQTGDGSSKLSSGSGAAATATGTASAGAGSLDQGSLQKVLPTTPTGQVCDLPNLGGSVAKFYPLFGLTEIPAIAVTVITSALDAFPNLLEITGLDKSLTQLGSLEGPICGTVLGGAMTSTSVATTTAPPVTVIVENGTTTTLTPTPTSSAAATTVPTSANGSLGNIGSGSLNNITNGSKK